MAEKLPVELLQTILDQALYVLDEDFEDVSPVSPFSRATSSSVDILQVCTRWNMVGLPLLYKTVIIRSSAQARALGTTLVRHASLGRLVRMFRLEASYESFTPAVLANITNVIHVALPLDREDSTPHPTDIEFILEQWRPPRLSLITYRQGTGSSLSIPVYTLLEKFLSHLPLVRHI